MAMDNADSVKVSVIIPSIGRTHPLTDCLAALSRQTIRSEMEIIVSLDGMIDVDHAVVSAADRVIKGPHGGPAVARNRGWRASART